MFLGVKAKTGGMFSGQLPENPCRLMPRNVLTTSVRQIKLAWRVYVGYFRHTVEYLKWKGTQ